MNFQQAVVFLAEIRRGRGIRHAHQPALKIVGPLMIGAGDELRLQARVLRLAKLGPAMAAGVSFGFEGAVIGELGRYARAPRPFDPMRSPPL